MMNVFTVGHRGSPAVLRHKFRVTMRQASLSRPACRRHPCFGGMDETSEALEESRTFLTMRPTGVIGSVITLS